MSYVVPGNAVLSSSDWIMLVLTTTVVYMI